jgi:NAD+ synthase (glutamine-hydrolysing)
MLNIAMAQINPTVGDFEGNLRLIREYAQAACEREADMVVFPELALTGYYPGDLLDASEFESQLFRAQGQLVQLSKELPARMTLVVGLPTFNPPGRGKRYFNSLWVLQQGEVLRSYDKQLLPTYNIFDERRHFEPGADVACVAKIAGTHVGFIICEDGWNAQRKDYSVNPLERLSQAGVDLVVSINASPSNLGKQAVREELFTRTCDAQNLPLLYVNQVGGQDSIVFDGASFAVNPGEAPVFQSASFEQALDVLEFDPAAGVFTRANGKTFELPVRKLSYEELYRQQIICGLRDYARRCGFSKVVVGSSGGIDSALTLALATQALGAENVVALAMPSSISSSDSVTDSEQLAKNLGIAHHIVPIGEQVEAFQRVNTQSLGRPLQGLALENLQARIRGTLLMSYSNTNGHLVLTTGNKSEISVGYCTLYGDTNGGLGLIGDLYKMEVYALARHINAQAQREVIPQNILDKEPSAELAPGQRDRDSLPPYDELDVMLKWLIEGRQLPDFEYEVVGPLFDQLRASQPEAVAKVRKLIAGSEYKRRQAAPLLRLRSRAFGNGRQIPITAKQLF